MLIAAITRPLESASCLSMVPSAIFLISFFFRCGYWSINVRILVINSPYIAKVHLAHNLFLRTFCWRHNFSALNSYLSSILISVVSTTHPHWHSHTPIYSSLIFPKSFQFSACIWRNYTISYIKLL